MKLVTHPWIWNKTLLLINAPETSPTSQRPTGSSRGRVMSDHGQGKAHSLWDSWPYSINVKTMKNLPPHLKKVSLSESMSGAVNRRCNCANKESSHCPSKVGGNGRTHGSVSYLITSNGVSEYSYISQRNLSIFRDDYKIFWLLAAFKKNQTTTNKQTQKNKTKNPWSSSLVSGNKHIFTLFYWTFPEEISNLTWQQGESAVNSLESK